MAQNSIQIGSWRLSWPILSLSWAVLGLSWPVMGLSWLVLGLSWACLGLPWVCLGSVLGLSWRVFGLPWPVLGLSWAVLACLGLSWACLGLRRACLQTFFNIVLSGIAATRVWCSVLSACSCPSRCSEHLYPAVLEPTRFYKHDAWIAAGNSCWFSLADFRSSPAARRYVRSTWNWLFNPPKISGPAHFYLLKLNIF